MDEGDPRSGTSREVGQMDIERAFKAPFADAKWFEKTLWAALWSGLGVTAPAVVGYMLDYTRNVANGYETPLPEWNKEFGRWWVRGFLVLLAGFIFMLPALILLLIGFIPFIGAIAASGGSTSDAANAFAVVGTGTICITSIVAVIYGIAVALYFPAAQAAFALSQDFGALFRFKDVIARLRTVGAGYFAAWGMSLLISLAAGVVGGIVGSILGATGVLAILSGFVGGGIGFVASVMTSHLYGQYAAKAYGLSGLQPVYAAAPAYPPAAYPPPAPGAYVPAAPPAPPAPPMAAPQPAPPAPPAPPMAAPQPAPPVPPAPPAGPAAEPPTGSGA
jgi:hypothetical protein